MTAEELKRLYFDFFTARGHTLIQGASLIPQEDSTILFTPAGMQPLVPYLLGEKHPAGNRLVDVQKCIRTGDIEEVGDSSHLTFFEMLGNWSLGDYFKRESIQWSFEFLTGREWLGFSPERLHVTVFAGDGQAPPDEEAAALWEEVGVPGDRIYFLGREDNWWGPTGATGPCGPDTEMFIDTGRPACGPECRPGCGCGKYFEVWNDVFMEYRKTALGEYVPMGNRNVDTGMGVARTVAMINGCDSIFDIPQFRPLFGFLKKLSGTGDEPSGDARRSLRIISDHIRTATHVLGDDQGIPPSNLDRGYVLRRLIRLAVRHGRKLGIDEPFTHRLAELVIETESGDYPELARNRNFVMKELEQEEERFEETLQSGLREFEKLLPNLSRNPSRTIPGRVAFKLYDTYGFPVEFTAELASEHGLSVDMDGYTKAFDRHRELSRQGSEGKFKGGLADNSEMVTKLHTATHLLHQALREVLGDHVEQKGSNITEKRLRFDFSHPDAMTDSEIRLVEEKVNGIIKADLPIVCQEKVLEDALEEGAIGLFRNRYGDMVKVYRIGDFSMEICGGPHVSRTGELGGFRIISEKSSSRGVRRIRAVLE
ncbi:MAG: alanine--tRNA ligase [Candidatus Fermentibacteraceae bacterium]|nr:alanine--tRNA ligase [Candidatus Fermentibacteraceae bacterium]MBN2607986.1 alanine--tRNA ligase [Candidatus Fermentibacteraceae bacterium]